MTYRKAIVMPLLLVIAATAYTGYWFYARATAAEMINDWVTQRRDEGYDIAFDAIEFGGFPLLIHADLNQPRLRRGEFSWQGERLSIEFRPWNFRRIRADFKGKQLISLTGGRPPIALASKEAAIVARLSSNGRLADADLLLRDLELSNSDGKLEARVAEIWVQAKVPETTPAKHTDKNLSLSASAAEIVLSELVADSLGREISKFRADIQLKGPLPRGAIKDALDVWRRNGGTLDIDWFHMVWGPADLRAKGTAALDAQSRPLGAFTADVRGYNHVLEALVARSVLERKTVTLAKIGLSLLAKSPPEGGEPVLTIPVTAQDGHLYAGPVKILDLAPIRLPAPAPPR